MAKIKEHITMKVVKSLGGSVDFYYNRGHLIARKWPRHSSIPYTSRQLDARNAFKRSREYIKLIPPALREAYRVAFYGKDENWVDFLTSRYIRYFMEHRKFPPEIYNVKKSFSDDEVCFEIEGRNLSQSQWALYDSDGYLLVRPSFHHGAWDLCYKRRPQFPIVVGQTKKNYDILKSFPLPYPVVGGYYYYVQPTTIPEGDEDQRLQRHFNQRLYYGEHTDSLLKLLTYFLLWDIWPEPGGVSLDWIKEGEGFLDFYLPPEVWEDFGVDFENDDIAFIYDLYDYLDLARVLQFRVQDNVLPIVKGQGIISIDKKKLKKDGWILRISLERNNFDAKTFRKYVKIGPGGLYEFSFDLIDFNYFKLAVVDYHSGIKVCFPRYMYDENGYISPFHLNTRKLLGPPIPVRHIMSA